MINQDLFKSLNFTEHNILQDDPNNQTNHSILPHSENEFSNLVYNSNLDNSNVIK